MSSGILNMWGGQDPESTGFTERWSRRPSALHEEPGSWDAESGGHCLRVELPSRRMYLQAVDEPDVG